MATVFKSLAELQANPPLFSPDDLARLDAMTEEDIIRAARERLRQSAVDR